MNDMSKDGIKKVRMIKNKVWFVSYAIEWLVDLHTGGHLGIKQGMDLVYP
jgi:hypothetical protein